MLTELRIRNFALIDELSVRLGPGLNVLTGETGAGKSIIVGALSLLLGERASADVVRTGADRASVEGVFELDAPGALTGWLEERGIEPADGILVLKREVAVEGRNRAWINGSPTTAGLLGELGRYLVDLHGQHEHQTLLKRDEQRMILDAYAGTSALADSVGRAYTTLREIRDQIQNLELRRREVAQRADFLRFQVEEIEAADLRTTEDSELDEQQSRLGHSEELTAIAGSLQQAILGDDDSLLNAIGGLHRGIEQLVRIDATQASTLELYDTAYYALEELGNRMAEYLAGIEHDPGRLEEIRQRKDLIFRLKTKYGSSLEEVLDAGKSAREELDLIDNAGWELSSLQQKEEAASVEMTSLAADLSAQRVEAMGRLAQEVNEVLPELGMTGGNFEPVAYPLSPPGPHGAEDIEFRVALNKGFSPLPLAQVASGGELSRVMLALKTILARLDSVPTLVFDEVDSGIGGKIALQVGDKMREVAESHQVFAITHLPQIASRGHNHLLVLKEDREGITATDVRHLESDDRIREIARMLGGDPESPVSMEHARELLKRGAS
ncbi:MAG TPA: DNA repair protein RecN [Longimicrobiaceae bacterium]|nr:DNA repair protein RecN [Longimicrobiaceae bacterium]